MKTNLYIKSLCGRLGRVKSFKFSFTLMLLFVSHILMGQISGVVFRDYNSNGVQNDFYPTENGIEGVVVKAFINNGNTVFTTTTNSTGAYAFSASEVPSGQLARIEFPNTSGEFFNGLSGGQNATTIRFVTGGQSNINLGFLRVEDYCQSNPFFSIPCYVNGDPMQTTGDPSKDAAEADALVAFDYKAVGKASESNFPPLHFGLGKDMGATWGVTYHARSKQILSTAMLRRHAGFGPLGTGGMYKTDHTTGTTTPYVDLKTLGIDTGPDPHTTLTGDKTDPNIDPLAYALVGKVGLGGMDITASGKSVFVSNLYDKSLYKLNVGSYLKPLTSADVTKLVIPNGDCPNGDFVPWALTIDGSNVWVGVVCTGETSQQSSELKATVYKIDTSGTGGFTKILQFPLDFTRGPTDRTGDCIKYDHWEPWTNDFPTPCAANFVMHPQPILSDIYFDADGNMNLGFLDRFGFQSGSWHPDLNGVGSYQGFTGGDLLKAFKNTDGSYSLENNGSGGGLTGSGVGNNQGPGGGEFYADDSWKFFGNVAHDEVLNGGLLVIPGYNEVLSTSIDPINEMHTSAGWQVYDTRNGTMLREFAIWGTFDINVPRVVDGTFGKSAGLGNGKALCEGAPIEIGNRVWADTDKDGIQDPEELGIDGVTVELCDAATGQVVGTTVTANNGHYYFNNSNVSTTATNKGLEYEKNYVLKIPKNQNVLSAYPSISPINTGGNDGIDADAINDNGVCKIFVKTGDLGQVNHSLDFGFTGCLVVDSIQVSDCDLWTNTYRIKASLSYSNNPKKTLRFVLTKPSGEIIEDSLFTSIDTLSNQNIILGNYPSSGLADMKLNISVVGSEAIQSCNEEFIFTAPAPCIDLNGENIDPMGLIYCEETGEIIKGGSINISGPGEAIVLEDGKNGSYRWYISAEYQGVYHINYTPPAGYFLSDKCVPENDTLYLTGLPNPYMLGADMTADQKYIQDNDCTPFFNSISILAGDPHLLFNNIALKGCCTVKPAAGADTSFCIGSSTLNLNDAGFNEKWTSLTTNPANISINATTGEVTGLTTPGVYKFQLTRGLDYSTCRDTVSITVFEKSIKPTLIVDKPTPCKNELIRFTASGCTGQVSWSNGATGFQLSLNITKDTTITASCTQSGKCESDLTSMTVSPKALVAAPSINGPAAWDGTMCAGSEVILSSTACNNGTILWSTGATTSSINVSLAGRYFAFCQNDCGKSDTSNIINVTLLYKPNAPVITGGGGICQGQSISINGACENGSTILWSTGETTSTILVNQAGSFTAKCLNACGESNISNAVTVVSGAAPGKPGVSAAGPTSLCTGASVVLNVTGCTGQVKWFKGGQLLNIVGVSQTVSEPGLYAVTCSNDCGESQVSDAVEITSLAPPIIPTVSGGGQICQGESIVLTASACAAGSTLQWSTGATTATITVNVAGSYSAICKNTCGNSLSSLPTTVSIGDLPAKPTLSPSGTFELCGSETKALTVTGCSGNTKWYKDGQLLSIVGSPQTFSEEGSYTVACVNSCGESPQSIPVVLTKSQKPAAPGISGGGNICIGNSLTLTASVCASGSTLKWSNGQTSQTISVGSSGSYSAICTNSCGDSPASNSVSVVVNQIPKAGVDINIACVSGSVASTTTLAATALTGASWVNAAGNPAGATIASPTSANSTVSGLLPGQVYQFVYTNGTCHDTMKVVTASCAILGSIGDYVWKDTNSNGQQDTGEPYISGLKVILWSATASGAPFAKLDSAITVSGFYKFQNLAKGNYLVQFLADTAPADCDGFTTQNTGNDASDSDVNTNGFSAPVAIDPALGGIAKDNMSVDAGLVGASADIVDPCRCHDILYYPGEHYEVLDIIEVKGKPGATWKIIEQTGMQIIDSTYDINIPIGTALIEVSPGKYQLKFAHDAGIGYTVKVSNGRITLSMSNICELSDIFANNIPKSLCPTDNEFVLESEAFRKINGVVSPSSGSFKYFILSNTKDTTYITSLKPSNYAGLDSIKIYVKFLPDQTVDCPKTTEYVVKINTGTCTLGSIGNYVWKDANQNGLQDAGEAPVNGLKVILWSVAANGAPNSKLDSTTTSGGAYLFNNLAKGSYLVQFVASSAPADCDGFTIPNAGDDSKDSDVASNGFSPVVNLDPALGGILQHNLTIDAGLKPKGPDCIPVCVPFTVRRAR